MLKIKLSYWNVEVQHWLLDVQFNEDKMTAKKGNAVQNGAILKRFCLLMRKYDPAFESKPLKRFLMANEHDIKRIEDILFVKFRRISSGDLWLPQEIFMLFDLFDFANVILDTKYKVWYNKKIFNLTL